MNSEASVPREVAPNPQRPLAGCRVGISISESEQLGTHGFDSAEVNRCVARLAESLLGAGARLVFGHDWRPGGVMEAVAAIAVRYFPTHPDAPGQPTRSEGAPILNRVAPPDVPFLHRAGSDPAQERMRAMLRGIVDAQQAKIVAESVASDPRIARARALRSMREELTGMCDARICLGGRMSGFAGWFPGIAEEAHLALDAGQPLYISTIFGGAAAQIAEAFASSRPVVFEPQPIGDLPNAPAPLEMNRASAAPNGLKPEEQLRLWRSTSLEECVELILRGLVQRRMRR